MNNQYFRSVNKKCITKNNTSNYEKVIKKFRD